MTPITKEQFNELLAKSPCRLRKQRMGYGAQWVIHNPDWKPEPSGSTALGQYSTSESSRDESARAVLSIPHYGKAERLADLEWFAEQGVVV